MEKKEKGKNGLSYLIIIYMTKLTETVNKTFLNFVNFPRSENVSSNLRTCHLICRILKLFFIPMFIYFCFPVTIQNLVVYFCKMQTFSSTLVTGCEKKKV